MELTEVKFWDNYWANCRLPNVVDYEFSFDRCLAKELKESLRGYCNKTILEIGCAPGKWLAFFQKELELLPSGIEYSRVGLDATKKNFDMLDIKYGSMWEGDFLRIPVIDQFDIVLSLGFVEHFDDPKAVIKQHVEWLKPGGLLIIGVPNFKGIYKHLQSILDKSIIEKHNLDIMELSYFSNIACECGLSVKQVNYIGSFEPFLPIPKPGIANVSQLVVKVLLRAFIYARKLRFLDHINHRLLSSYILAVYQKSV
jgi:SAM-dependent methyltransferase